MEYKVVVVTVREESEALAPKLNEAGADGWKLHTLVSRGDSLVALLERRTEAELIAEGTRNLAEQMRQ